MLCELIGALKLFTIYEGLTRQVSLPDLRDLRRYRGAHCLSNIFIKLTTNADP